MHQHPSLLTHLNSGKKLVFVGGKGGVGKTTVSAALAARLSKEGKTLLISTDPAHSLSESLDLPVGKNKVDVSDNWELLELNADQEFEAFKKAHQQELYTLLDTSSYLDHEDIHQMLEVTIPGVDEIMGLKAISELFNSGQYITIIVDTAPTGHTLRLLFLPELLNQWIKMMAALRWKYRFVQKTFKGKYDTDGADDLLMALKRTVSRMKKILIDDQVCEFILVSNPQRMVLSETVDYLKTLQAYQIQANHLIINRVSPASIDPFYQKIHDDQQQVIQLHKQQFPNLNLMEMPLYPYELKGMASIKQLEDFFNEIQQA